MRMYMVVVLTVFLFALGCGSPGPAKKPPQPDRNTGAKQSAAGNNSKVVRLPWANDPEFVRAAQEHRTPLLMASYHATLPDPILDERHNISLAADYLRGAVVQPGEVFSLNGRIGWRSAERGFKRGPMYSGGRITSTVGGGVCKIASVIYNVAILADQEIVERHPHSMTVPYVPPGQDATISYGTLDFKFRNTSGSPILIWARNTGGTLFIAFYGSVKPPGVRWIHKVLSETDTRTEYVNDYTLPKGTEKVIYEGSKGITVHSWVVVNRPGKKETKKDLGISSYIPCPRVIAVGRQ